MIGEDKIAEERKRWAFSEEIASSAADAARLRALAVAWFLSAESARWHSARHTTLRPEFGAIDGMDTEAQQDAAARMKARIDSNLEDAGFEGMRVQIELQPARARLVKVEM